jgi:hypothetical protein
MNIHSGASEDGRAAMTMTTKSILITGATTGLGKHAALWLAER